MLRRRRGEPGAAAGAQPGAAQPEFRQQALQQRALHPDVRAEASQRRRGPVLPSVAGLRQAPVSGAERSSHLVWHLEPAPQQPGACRDVRRAAVHRGVHPALRQAWCLGPALRSAQVLLSVRVWWSAVPQALPDALREPQVPERALPWVLAVSVPAAPQEEQPREAVSEPGAPRALPEAAVSVHAVAEPRPEAVTVASEQPAVGAAAAPDESEPAAVAVAVSDVTARRPAAAERADAGEQPRAAARRGVQELPAALRPEEAALRVAQQAAAGPSVEAASICRSLAAVSAPAQPRAARRFVHAMRCLPIASRSEPSSQAARNEGWSWRSTSPEGSLTKCLMKDEVL